VTQSPPPPAFPIPIIATSGFATIYLTLPAGSFIKEWLGAKKRLASIQGAVEGTELELLHILGQASMAARLQLNDFRGLIRRVYPSATSKTILANTVFSIPYVTDRPLRQRADSLVRFMTHMRVRRTVYVKDPVLAESFILEELRKLTDVEGATVSIEAGIGWADFVLSGAMHTELFHVFLEWLVKFNGMRIPDEIGEPGYTFKRTLTLIGYPWTSETEQAAPIINGFKAPSKALLFIRAKRGRLNDVKEALQAAFKPVDIGFVDGKLDVVAICSDPKPDFFQRHQTFFLGAKKHSVERLETHLMFDSDAKSPPSPRYRRAPDCSCDKLATMIDAFLDGGSLDALPLGTATAIRNIGFLSSSNARDSASCCDARPAILAIWDSLSHLVALIHEQQVRSHGFSVSEDRKHSLHGKIRENIDLIDQWLVTSDRVLRQRTVGSFEEFLGQSDRALSYGGGVQKGLLLSDCLMNDFYAKMKDCEVEFRFASVYDSVDHITSIVRTGIVRIPVTKAFHLPGSLPDLWHEVGCYEFFRALPPSRFEQPVSDAWYRDLADYFGDLTSLVHGFDFDFHSFARAMVHGWHESSTGNESQTSPLSRESDEAKELSFATILSRLVAAFEFCIAVDKPELRKYSSRSRWKAFGLMERIATSYLGDRTPTRHTLRTKRALDILKSRRSDLEVIRGEIGPGDIERARERARRSQPGATLDAQPTPLVRFAEDTDLNATFRDLYRAIEKCRDPVTLKAKNAFAPMAALARSAAIEYYRRMAGTR
jgi:hypothetical protein